MVAGAKAAVPTVEDQLAALQLGTSAKATASALGLLRDAALRVSGRVGVVPFVCALTACAFFDGGGIARLRRCVVPWRLSVPWGPLVR